jgi:hypothetical protein
MTEKYLDFLFLSYVFCDGCSDNEDRDIGDAHADDDEDSCLVY